MGRVRNIHFVGIGGVGMSGIAEVLLNLGYTITGTDLKESNATHRLAALGARIFYKHQAECIQGADVVVTSTAIEEDNPEIVAAKQHMVPIIPRAEMLAELMRFRQGIAIAGTHGKTTTTSITASLLADGGLDPTFIIGGKLNSAGSNARLGSGQYLVAEADESDASFLFLKPMMAVVTNIDTDHMATYQDSLAVLEDTFLRFLQHLPFYGLAVLCTDDPHVLEVMPRITRPFKTYGFNDKADVRAVNYSQVGCVSHFTVQRANKPDLDLSLNMPGKHNVQNALAAITIASELGVSDESIKQTLSAFAGVGRRFQIQGEIKVNQGNALLIDDYGHHPREISSTLQAAREAWPERRIVLVFQPHRYTRTKSLFDDFVTSLSAADQVVLLDIYPAGEQPIPGIDAESLVKHIRECSAADVVLMQKDQNLQQVLQQVAIADDIVLTQGAGNIGKMSAELVEQIGA